MKRTKQRWTVLLLLALLAPFASSAAQGRGKLKVVAKIDVKSRFPDFTREGPTSMSQGALVYLGKGAWAKQQTQVFFRLATLKRFTIDVPFDAFMLAHPELRLEAGDKRPIARQFQLVKLVSYDEKNHEAGLLVRDHYNRRVRRQRTFLLRWDLAQKRITHATLLHERDTRDRHYRTAVRVLGYDHVNKEHWVAHTEKLAKGSIKVTLRAYKEGKARDVASFAAQRSLGSSVFFLAKRRKVVLVEYAERGSGGPPPRGYLIDLDASTVRTLEIPVTTYGVLIGKSGKQVYAYSAQLGRLWTIDATSGKKLAELRVGALGHALGPVGPGRAVLIRAGGLQLFSFGKRGLRKARFFPMRQVYPTVLNVSGSTVVGGYAVIRPGDTLYVVALPN